MVEGKVAGPQSGDSEKATEDDGWAGHAGYLCAGHVTQSWRTWNPTNPCLNTIGGMTMQAEVVVGCSSLAGTRTDVVKFLEMHGCHQRVEYYDHVSRGSRGMALVDAPWTVEGAGYHYRCERAGVVVDDGPGNGLLRKQCDPSQEAPRGLLRSAVQLGMVSAVHA